MYILFVAQMYAYNHKCIFACFLLYIYFMIPLMGLLQSSVAVFCNVKGDKYFFHQRIKSLTIQHQIKKGIISCWCFCGNKCKVAKTVSLRQPHGDNIIRMDYLLQFKDQGSPTMFLVVLQSLHCQHTYIQQTSICKTSAAHFLKVCSLQFISETFDVRCQMNIQKMSVRC